MDAHTRARYESRARVLKALAHPTRLFIASQLAEERQCVAALTEMVGADMSTVSKHLSILKNAGIVRDEKCGAQVYYHLRVPCVLDFFNCIEKVIRSTAEEQLDLARR